ncbi:Zinc finger protein MAGPIE [Acorus gramineus]|uniref:Zinc finger protein MAGPIE n=1 Tax=Acorus gramineus TaxID=55184 RepID=A0AAV9BRM9_ACOGR|nr:Zinc finger protein MAGPIE [Acorus gramineus]
MATNRFICEICNKGFQRDQNLQLHRRGHNLPWKLRQRTSAEVKKRVYICPETSCVHHNPSRALGDLTGIKKHFCRKHGEKKWKCDKCSKKYAVQSDWKAHSKTCGTREYKCDCGTIFSRRDSFITHRAFCDALAEENNKLNQQQNLMASMVPSAMQAQVSDLMAHQSSMMMPPPPPPPPPIGSSSPSDFGSSPDTKNPLKSISNDPTPLKSLAMAHNGGGPMFFGPRTSTSLQLSGTLTYAGSAHMSATALLQKAAQMGATASGDSPMNQRSFMAGLVGGGGMIHPAHGPYDIQSAHMEGFSGPYEVHGLSEVGIFPDAGLYGMVSGDRPGPTTVDFLGVGGPSHVSQEFEQQQRYGFPQQVPSQAQASMERTIWDV